MVNFCIMKKKSFIWMNLDPKKETKEIKDFSCYRFQNNKLNAILWTDETISSDKIAVININFASTLFNCIIAHLHCNSQTIQYSTEYRFSHRPSLQLFSSVRFFSDYFYFDLLIFRTVASDNIWPIDFLDEETEKEEEIEKYVAMLKIAQSRI